MCRLKIWTPFSQVYAVWLLGDREEIPLQSLGESGLFRLCFDQGFVFVDGGKNAGNLSSQVGDIFHLILSLSKFLQKSLIQTMPQDSATQSYSFLFPKLAWLHVSYAQLFNKKLNHHVTIVRLLYCNLVNNQGFVHKIVSPSICYVLWPCVIDWTSSEERSYPIRYKISPD